MAEIRPLREDDLDAGVAVLARAFRDNPGMVGVLGDDPHHRQGALEGFARSMIPIHRAHGEAWGAEREGAIRAVMLTLPPGAYPPALAVQLAMFWASLRSGGVSATWRFAKVDGLMRAQHTNLLHHYVFMLGTDPDWQGRGLGGALLEHLGERAGQDACYLETDKPTSVKLYERHGYRVLHEEDAPLGERAFKLWFMLRESGGHGLGAGEGPG